jgi:O-antigen/teichoic acid export membrane protein
MQKGIYDRGASFIQIGLIVTTTFSFVLIPLLTDAMSDQPIPAATLISSVIFKDAFV